MILRRYRRVAADAELRRALGAAKEREGERLESDIWRRTFEEDRPGASWPAVEEGTKRVLGVEG